MLWIPRDEFWSEADLRLAETGQTLTVLFADDSMLKFRIEPTDPVSTEERVLLTLVESRLNPKETARLSAGGPAVPLPTPGTPCVIVGACEIAGKLAVMLEDGLNTVRAGKHLCWYSDCFGAPAYWVLDHPVAGVSLTYVM